MKGQLLQAARRRKASLTIARAVRNIQEPKKQWEEGWVPMGWKRGQILRIKSPPATDNPQPHDRGYLSTEINLGSDFSGINYEVVMVTYERREVGQVLRWMKWWYEPVGGLLVHIEYHRARRGGQADAITVVAG